MSASTDNVVFRGTAPALVTPFTAEDELDGPAFRNLIDWQIRQGADAVVVLGTTGENPTISPEERHRLTEMAVDVSNGRIPVIVGTGTNSTRESVGFSRNAEKAGVDALLIVGPYYNKPAEEGICAHVSAIASATDCPIILYNVPARTGLNISADTVLRLADDVPAVVGVKEASGNLKQVTDILKGRPNDLAVYSGDDEITFPMLALGADGAVSVLSNALPERFGEMVRRALADDFVRARELHLELLEAMRACFVETNPIPIKSVLSAMGYIQPNLRLPLTPVPEGSVRDEILEPFHPYLDLEQ
jgi:4-hydroxy-tetrahydrodipicolinate synthase